MTAAQKAVRDQGAAVTSPRQKRPAAASPGEKESSEMISCSQRGQGEMFGEEFTYITQGDGFCERSSLSLTHATE